MEEPLSGLESGRRTLRLHHHIDPGFINVRKCYAAFGRGFVDVFERHRKRAHDHWAELYNDHLLVDLALRVLEDRHVRSLGEALAEPDMGALFCSTETLEGNNDVYHKNRVRNRVLLQFGYERDVYLEFSTGHFVTDTGKLEQSLRSVVSVVGQIRAVEDDAIMLNPLIMGAPSLDHPENRDSGLGGDLLLYGYNWYQVYPKDIDEFSKLGDVSDVSAEEWMGKMQELAEPEVKRRIAELLGDATRDDWPGELADHCSTVHLNGEAVDAAFLLKGPGKGFREMTPAMLGRNADQIYRLAQTPAGLLAVQHCHMIGEAVRATLRAFAVLPHHPRQYCLIDGKDTFRILKAYGKLE
jgi:hypothetical protein